MAAFCDTHIDGEELFLVYNRFNTRQTKLFSLSGIDHHSGYKEISSEKTVLIQSDKQIINYGGLTIHGTLIIEGDLILK